MAKKAAFVTLLFLITAFAVGGYYILKMPYNNATPPRFEVIAREYVFPVNTVPFEQCHASTLCLTGDGALLCAWYGGSAEGKEDTAIWLSARDDNGNWEPPEKIADGGGTACWNPVLYADNGHILLFYKTGQTIEKWQTMVTESGDGGITWSESRELVANDFGGRGPVKNKPIRLKSGAILAPASTESDKWECFADRSEDGGRTWERSGSVDADYREFKGKGLIQPALWQDRDGTVHMMMRSTEGFIFRSESKDDGRTWSKAVKTKLPNNNSGIDVTRLENGMLVLVYNPVSTNARSPIAFSVSRDNGKTWSEPQQMEYVLCDEERYTIDTEFSYPAIVSEGNDAYISYTWKRKGIAFWHLRFEG